MNGSIWLKPVWIEIKGHTHSANLKVSLDDYGLVFYDGHVVANHLEAGDNIPLANLKELERYGFDFPETTAMIYEEIELKRSQEEERL